MNSRNLPVCSFRLRWSLLVAWFLGHVVSAFAQSGAVTGSVSNAATGAFLSGAAVSIPSLGRQEYTDESGRFSFTGLPAANYVLEVSYTGLDAASASVHVAPGERASLNFDLTSAVYQLQEFKVTGEREGQAASITRQRNAPNVKSVVSLDTFGNLANENPGELLIRLAGVSPYVVDDGEVFAVNVRGIDSNRNSVTIDGSKMATSGPLDRQFRFLNISAGFFDEIEVTKAPTPDMDADSLGGAINMKTKSTLKMKERRSFTYRVGAKWAAPFWEHVPYRQDHSIHPSTSLGYQEVRDAFGGRRNLGVSLNAFYIEAPTSSANTTRDYAFTLADPAYVYDYRTTDSYNVRTQRSVTLKIDYEFATGTRLAFSGMINDAFESAGKTFNTRITAGRTVGTTGTAGILPGYTNLVTEGRPVASSIFSTTVGSSGFFDRQRRLQLDLEHNFGRLFLDGSANFSQSKVAQNSGYKGDDLNSGSFVTDVRNVGWRLDQTKSQIYPEFTQTAGASIYDLSSYGNSQLNQRGLGRLGRVVSFSGNARYRLPDELSTTLKTGVRWRRQESQETGGDRRWTYVGADGVAGVNPATGRNDDDLSIFRDTKIKTTSAYGMRAVPFVHIGTVVQSLKDHPELWREDAVFREMDIFASTDGVTEDVGAAYLMSQSKWGALGLLAGARVERTDVEGYGYVRPRTFPTITDPAVRAATEYGQRREIKGSYTDVFPGIHATYNATKQIVGRASWSTSVARPGFSTLVPRQDVNTTALTVTVNNPGLKPQYSNNYDLSLEYYFEPVGLLSAGVFMKDLSDFLFRDSGGVVGAGPNNGFDGQYSGYEIITQGNGGRARIRGLELAYQQRFTFLPGWLGGFGSFANYTRLLTRGDYGDGVSGSSNQVERFVPTTVNVGLSYNRGRLQARLMANYSGEQLWIYAADPSRQRYKEGRTVTSLNASWTLRRGVELYADISNLFHEPQRYYRGTGKTERLQSYVDNAPTITFGVSGRF